LLDGPTINIALEHGGSGLQYHHQMSSAKGMIIEDRLRQMQEQTDSKHMPFVVQFPMRALLAAAPHLSETLNAYTGSETIYCNFGNLLPVFAFEVLDWYVKALTTKDWLMFQPVQETVEKHDRWYYFYIYVAMKKLGMDSLAGQVGCLVEIFINRYGLAGDYGCFVQLLKHLSADDPLLPLLAKRYVEMSLGGAMSMLAELFKHLDKDFPHFGVVVREV
ncbi:hypothetical protein BDV95DRAFT_468969, partial [Massariosphaeria phaeospora]